MMKRKRDEVISSVSSFIREKDDAEQKKDGISDTSESSVKAVGKNDPQPQIKLNTTPKTKSSRIQQVRLLLQKRIRKSKVPDKNLENASHQLWLNGVSKNLEDFCWENRDNINIDKIQDGAEKKKGIYLLTLFKHLGPSVETPKAQALEAKFLELADRTPQSKESMVLTLVRVALRLYNVLAAKIAVAIVDVYRVTENFDAEYLHIQIGYSAGKEAYQVYTSKQQPNDSWGKNVAMNPDWWNVIATVFGLNGDVEHACTENFVLGYCASNEEKSITEIHWLSALVDMLSTFIVLRTCFLLKSLKESIIYESIPTCLSYLAEFLLNTETLGTRDNVVKTCFTRLLQFNAHEAALLSSNIGLSAEEIKRAKSICCDSMPVRWSLVQNIFDKVSSLQEPVAQPGVSSNLLSPDDALWVLETLIYRAAKYYSKVINKTPCAGITFDIEEGEEQVLSEAHIRSKWYGLAKSVSRPGMTNNLRKDRIDLLITLLVILLPEKLGKICWNAFPEVKTIVHHVITGGIGNNKAKTPCLTANTRKILKGWETDLDITQILRKVRKPFDFALASLSWSEDSTIEELISMGVKHKDWILDTIALDNSFARQLSPCILFSVYFYSNDDVDCMDRLKQTLTELLNDGGMSEKTPEDSFCLKFISLFLETTLGKIDIPGKCLLKSFSHAHKRLQALFKGENWMFVYLCRQPKSRDFILACKLVTEFSVSAVEVTQSKVDSNDNSHIEPTEDIHASFLKCADRFIDDDVELEGDNPNCNSNGSYNHFFAYGYYVSEFLCAKRWILFYYINTEEKVGFIEGLSKYMQKILHRLVKYLQAPVQEHSKNAFSAFVNQFVTIAGKTKAMYILKIINGVEALATCLLTCISRCSNNIKSTLLCELIQPLLREYVDLHIYWMKENNGGYIYSMEYKNLIKTAEIIHQKDRELAVKYLGELERLKTNHIGYETQKATRVIIESIRPQPKNRPPRRVSNKSDFGVWDIGDDLKNPSTFLNSVTQQFESISKQIQTISGHPKEQTDKLHEFHKRLKGLFDGLVCLLSQCESEEIFRRTLVTLTSSTKNMYDSCIKSFPKESLDCICMSVKGLVQQEVKRNKMEEDNTDVDPIYYDQEEEGFSVSFSDSYDIPVLKCSESSVERIIALLHLESTGGVSGKGVRSDSLSSVQDRLFLISLCMADKNTIFKSLDNANLIDYEEFIRVSYFMYPSETREWLLSHLENNKGMSLSPTWETWLNDEMKGITNNWDMYTLSKKKTVFNTPILKALKCIESLDNTEQMESILVLRMLCIRHPFMMIGYLDATIMLFQGSPAITDANVSLLEGVLNRNLLGEPVVMQGIVAVWEALSPFIVRTPQFETICLLIFRLFDLFRAKARSRSNNNLEYVPVVSDCTDLIFLWMKADLPAIKKAILNYTWSVDFKNIPQDFMIKKRRDDGSNIVEMEKLSDMYPFLEFVSVMIGLEKSQKTVPKLRYLKTMLFKEEDRIIRENYHSNKSLPFNDTDLTRYFSQEKGSESEVENISCDKLEGNEKKRIDSLLEKGSTQLATLIELLDLATVEPSIISLFLKRIRNIAFETFLKDERVEVTEETTLCIGRALEILLIYMYSCKNETEICSIFAEYVSFLASSETPVEAKKQALSICTKFAMFAINKESFQKLLRVSYGFGSSASVGSISYYKALTTCLRADFKDL